MRYSLLLLLLPLTSYAQDSTAVVLTLNEQGQYHYQAVIEAPGAPDQLYDRAMAWIALNYVSANDVVQLSDRENRQIIAKGAWSVRQMLAAMWINHTLQIEAREGRYRVTYGQFTAENQSGRSGEIPFESRSLMRGGAFRRQAAELITDQLADLQRAMASGSTQEDW